MATKQRNTDRKFAVSRALRILKRTGGKAEKKAIFDILLSDWEEFATANEKRHFARKAVRAMFGEALRAHKEKTEDGIIFKRIGVLKEDVATANGTQKVVYLVDMLTGPTRALMHVLDDMAAACEDDLRSYCSLATVVNRELKRRGAKTHVIDPQRFSQAAIELNMAATRDEED